MSVAVTDNIPPFAVAAIPPCSCLTGVPNGSTSNWHIKLRNGVTFHDGKPFGADDVIYTLRRIVPSDRGMKWK